MLKYFRTVEWSLLIAIMAATSVRAEATDVAGMEFFEKKVRPILVENCYKCHSRESVKVKGGLLMDTREALLKGGDTGPALVPGDMEKSLLIKAVRYNSDDLQMPPKGKKLAAEQIADLETWVKMGAPDPRVEVAAGAKAKPSSANHWAFQPIKDSAVPVVKNSKWIKTPVDAFILAKLEAKDLKPSPMADKRTLIRRATFDLTGLPPTTEEVDKFLADKSTDGFARVVDRLLASPRYGERWGRHWLDVARYADTKGYVFEEERRYAYSYTYRDYVIRSFNEDLPYNQFITQQIAADLLPLGEDKRSLAALGFLTLGRRFLNNQNDIIDDRIDVVCRGTMALTVACARCHDHKFDPIPTKDYYSLYGVFESSSEPAEKPLLGGKELPKEYNEYLTEHQKREDALKNYRSAKEDEVLTHIRSLSGTYLLALHDAPPASEGEKRRTFIQSQKLSARAFDRWADTMQSRQKNFDPEFEPWVKFSSLKKEEFAGKGKEILVALTNNPAKALNPQVAKIFTNGPPTSLEDLSERYNKLFSSIDEQWKSLLKAATNQAKPPEALPAPGAEGLRQLLYADYAPAHLEQNEVIALFDVAAAQETRRLQREVEGLDSTHPGAPPRAMAMKDNDTPSEPHVFKRGNAGNVGDAVPRQFLAIASGGKREPFKNGSGRLELAQAIVNPNNPLTARVLVNRVWLYHFGVGLVHTPSDFGVRSDPPTHPELLDYLATRFMKEGWSIKKLHRELMLSNTYQQTSESNPHGVELDPSNELLWKMNRQRLDFEAMRDSLLATGGKLDLSPGGRPVDIIAEPYSPRRTVYGYIDRQNLPNLFRTFDFASPDTTSPQRFFTTVPQQALFLLNSPFVLEQARNMIRTEPLPKDAPEKKRIEYLYEKAYQRKPASDEIKLAEHFLQAQAAEPRTPEPAVWLYGYGEFDPATKKTKSFHPLPFFNGKRWQNDKAFPDPILGYAMLNIEGGHPGNRPQHAVIRRWISPLDGTISIQGDVNHVFTQGDGIRARIVTSRQGEIGHWTVFHTNVAATVAQCEVKRGDTIDFIAEPLDTPLQDTFQWAPVIKTVQVAYGAPPPQRTEWNAVKDFDGPKKNVKPTDAWERLAQVILLSNEFFFVD